jgi:hypothetical protein
MSVDGSPADDKTPVPQSTVAAKDIKNVCITNIDPSCAGLGGDIGGGGGATVGSTGWGSAGVGAANGLGTGCAPVCYEWCDSPNLNKYYGGFGGCVSDCMTMCH